MPGVGRRFERRIADHDRPRSHRPASDESRSHVGVAFGEALDDRAIGALEYQERPVDRLGERAGEDQFAARMCGLRQRQVPGAVWLAPRDEIFDDVVQEGEVAHGAPSRPRETMKSRTTRKNLSWSSW
jgi:hypothetical protein